MPVISALKMLGQKTYNEFEANLTTLTTTTPQGSWSEVRGEPEVFDSDQCFFLSNEVN